MTTGDGGTELARLGKTPAEQAAAMVRPFSVLVWTATEIMHWAGMQGSADLAAATAVASSLAWGASARGWVPAATPAWIALAGGWTAAAWYFGPLAWLPAPMLTVIWVILLWTAHRAAHKHPAVADARQWRDARARWLMIRNDWGLGGTHLLGYQETYLGEMYEVSTKATGKRASQYTGNRAHEEYIAEAENLPRGRVQIRGHELAGRILISIRRRDPWAKPLIHPAACEDHEIEIPEHRSILDPALVGQDPETGAPLEVPLYDRETGGKNIAVTGIKGAGKGVLLDGISEHVTACDDAIMVRVNVSVKGYAEAAAWGPSCHLTAFGPEQKSRAVAVVKILNRIIEWRARTYRQGAYTPSPADPAFVLVVDESDAAAAVPELKRELDTFATKAREYGGVYAHAGQRNTNDYHSAKQRSQDDVHCTGMLANSNEARHAGGLSGPDMATYGEGHAGVWAIRLLGGSVSAGRTWVFAGTKAAHGVMVEALAAERAFTQPELPAACREYLGDSYAALLASEVFTRWAQDRTPDEFISRDDDWPQDTPAPVRPDDDETRAAAALPAAATATAVADPDLEEMLRTPMDDDARSRYAAVRERLSAAAASLAETAAMPRPEADPADRAAFIAQRWQQVTAGVQIPEGPRGRLLAMLGEGTTISVVARALEVKPWTARTWLEKLRDENLAYVDGERRGAHWRLAPPPGDGDAP
jgi:hypothetical protein